MTRKEMWLRWQVALLRALVRAGRRPLRVRPSGSQFVVEQEAMISGSVADWRTVSWHVTRAEAVAKVERMEAEGKGRSVERGVVSKWFEPRDGWTPEAMQ